MKKKHVISIVTFIVTIIVYVLWTNGNANPNLTRINEEVYIVKTDNSYSIYCEQPRYRYGSYNKLIASDIDSIIISYKYGTLFKGTNTNNKIECFYIDSSPVKNIHHDFSSIKEATSLTMGEHYLDSVMSAKVVWNKYNK